MSKPIDPREFKGLDVIKNIHNPESMVLWSQQVGAARDGRLPRSPCPHPMHAIEQFVDEEQGREGRPTNLFQCGVCQRLLRLTDAHGKDASDG